MCVHLSIDTHTYRKSDEKKEKQTMEKSVRSVMERGRRRNKWANTIQKKVQKKREKIMIKMRRMVCIEKAEEMDRQQ